MIKANDSTIKQIVEEEIKKLGDNADLNHIDVSEVTNMCGLFYDSLFYGDISQWNTYNVTDMNGLFYDSLFDGDISQWNVSNVTNMNDMFHGTIFNGDISKWDVSKVIDMRFMFYKSSFNGDISKWDTNNVTNMIKIFYESSFRGDVSKWNPTLKDENDPIIKVIDDQKLLPPFNPPKTVIAVLPKIGFIKSLYSNKLFNDSLYEESWREYHDKS